MFNTQLAGGFFNQDNERNDGNRMSSGGKGQFNSPNKFNKKGMRVVPLTIKSILEASGERSDDIIEIDGTPVEHCIIVGRVFEITESPTGKTLFAVDDTTGKITIQLIKKDTGVPKSLQNISFQKNIYIRAMVSIRPFKGSKNYMCTKVQEVTDYNQVTYHMLNVFLARAQRTKGYLNNGPAPDATESNVLVDTNQNNRQSLDMGGDPTKLIKIAMNKIIMSSTNGFCEFFTLQKELKGRFDEKTLRGYLKKMLVNGDVMNMADDNTFVLINQN